MDESAMQVGQWICLPVPSPTSGVIHASRSWAAGGEVGWDGKGMGSTDRVLVSTVVGRRSRLVGDVFRGGG